MSVSPASAPTPSSSPQPALVANWDELFHNFVVKCIEVSERPEKAAMKDLLVQLNILIRIDPKSINPYLVLFVYLTDRFDFTALKMLISEAKAIDFHLTYAALLYITMRNSLVKPPALTQKAIKCLQAVYQDDLILPQIAQTSELDFSPIGESLKWALDEMAVKKPLAAVKRLIGETTKLAGYSIIQHYLVLGYLLNGSVTQAKFLFSRCDKLLSIEKPFHLSYVERFMASTLQNCFNPSNPVNFFEQAPINTPLSVMIEMVEAKEVDLPLALKFIQVCTDTLKSNPQELPFVYFGLRFLIPKFKYHWRTVSQPLIDLMCLTAEICYQGKVDPWIQAKFKRIELGEELTHEIDFFDGETAPEIAPQFQFSKGLKLERSSIDSLATCVTKQLFGLLKDHLESAALSDGLQVEIPTSVPVDPTAFKESLFSRLMGDEGIAQIYLAANQLRSLLRCNPPPFDLDEPFLNWAKFCVFSEEAPSFFENCPMDRDILQRYYPKTFRKENLDSFIALQKKICPQTQGLPRIARLAARDALLASEDLLVRAEDSPCERGNHIYGLYQTSKQMFGWRFGESFEEWGKRLEELSFNGTQEPPIFGFFRQFWIKFHQEAKESAQRMGLAPLKATYHIPLPKDLKNGFKKSIGKAVVQKPPTKSSIIARKKISDVSASSLTLHNRFNLDPIQYILKTAAAVVCEADLCEQPHCKIFVDKGEDVVFLNQILLEITLDRLVRRAIATLGPEPVDDKTTLSALAIYLTPLHGNFYFPDPNDLFVNPYHAMVATTEGISKQSRFSFHIGRPPK